MLEPSHLGLGPNAARCPSARSTQPRMAALWSFAQLLRMSSALELDIDPRELEIGLQPCRVAMVVTRRVFIADRLENGAGYSSQLGEPQLLESVLDRIVDEIGATPRRARPPIALRQRLSRLPAQLRQPHAAPDARLAARPRPRRGRCRRPLDTSRWLAERETIAQALAQAFDLDVKAAATLVAIRDDRSGQSRRPRPPTLAVRRGRLGTRAGGGHPSTRRRDKRRHVRPLHRAALARADRRLARRLGPRTIAVSEPQPSRANAAARPRTAYSRMRSAYARGRRATVPTRTFAYTVIAAISSRRLAAHRGPRRSSTVRGGQARTLVCHP